MTNPEIVDSLHLPMYSKSKGSFNILQCLNLKDWDLDDGLAAVLFLIAVAVWCKNALLSKPPSGYHLYFTSPQREDGLDKGVSASEESVSRNINDRMNELKKEIIVFWGSQSGKSERLAKEFVRECVTRFDLTAMAADIDMFDFDQLAVMPKERYVGFVVATYGEGDPTDNALGLYDYLHALRSHQPQPLAHLQYFCFGLGSSQYQSYNRFVEFVDESLSSAGAKKIAPVGKIDEALRSDEPWLSWKESVMRELAARFGKIEQAVITQSVKPTVSLLKCAAQESHGSAEAHAAEHSPSKGKHQQHTQIAQITKIHQISHSRSQPHPNAPRRQYLHVELNTKTTNGALKYRTGDHLAIWPINADHEVNLMAEAFGWDDETMKQTVTLQRNERTDIVDSTFPVDTPTTRDSILRYQLDICGPLFPETVSLLILYCPTIEGKSYLSGVLRNQNGWEELLAQYLTCAQLMRRAVTKEKWPEVLFCALLQTLPRLRPRYYSIASSSIVDPESIALTVSVLQTRLAETNGTFCGLTTGYLQSLSEWSGHDNSDRRKSANFYGSPYPHYNLSGPRGILAGGKVFAHVRPTPFNLPPSSDVPIVMFAAGSGIAPFRAFVQERLSLSNKGEDTGLMTLFFGFRSRDELLYADLWNESASAKILTTHFAFSADPDTKRKIYIQDLLQGDTGENVADAILEEGAMVYICGSSSMATGVKTALDVVLRGKTSVVQLKGLKRLHEDVWIS